MMDQLQFIIVSLKLGIQICKLKNNISLIIMCEIFPDRNNNGQDFELSYVNSTRKGQETLRFMGTKIWDIIPDRIKESSLLSTFGSQKRMSTLCKDYVQGLHYVCIT